MAKEQRNDRRSDVRRIIQAIESVLNREIPGTPRLSGTTSGRVLYVALPGSGNKSKNVLSQRAQQVLATIGRQRKATSAALQKALDVNRNVIAGAIHELKQAKFVKAVPAGAAFETAGEFRPGRVRAESNDRTPRKKKTARGK
jgi:predicted HTH transcriptional regulator